MQSHTCPNVEIIDSSPLELQTVDDGTTQVFAKEFGLVAQDVDQPGEIEHMTDLHPTVSSEHQQWVDIVNLVSQSSQHNKDLCKIRVNCVWNFELLNSLLVDYHDKEIIHLLQYGWPVERDMSIPLEMGGRNHKGATDFQSDVDKYIDKEIALGAMIGAFDAIPFDSSVPVAISPLSSRPKKGTDKRRIIMHCSWPIGSSLNDGIDKNSYLGDTIKLVYPTVDDLSWQVYSMAKKSAEPIYFFKEDMDRMFRQIRSCTRSVPLLGFSWRNMYYFDLVMMMGCHIAPYVCQRTTDMIAYIHRQMSYYLLNYMDDFLGAEYESRIYDSHRALIRMLENVGIDRSSKKLVPPTQCIEFVGNLFDSVNLTIGVTPQRKVEVLQELNKWRFRTYCSRNNLESLIGKLQFMSNCIKPGQLFVSRLLQAMKGMKRGQQYKLTEQMRKDIKWWYLFLPGFLGTSVLWLLDVLEVDSEFATDSCLQGVGGVRGWEYFRCKFPKHVRRDTSIVHLELWAIIIAIRIWGEECACKVIRVKTDNEAVAKILNTGRSADALLQTLLRESNMVVINTPDKTQECFSSGETQ